MNAPHDPSQYKDIIVAWNRLEIPYASKEKGRSEGDADASKFQFHFNQT